MAGLCKGENMERKRLFNKKNDVVKGEKGNVFSA
jgi:hypothetical protein